MQPPAREPLRSWLARRSTMTTSTPANANSPANISPVGPPPTITTACSVIATLRQSRRRRTTRPRATRTSTTTHASRGSVGFGFGRRFYGMIRVLKQAPCSPYVRVGGVIPAIISVIVRICASSLFTIVFLASQHIAAPRDWSLTAQRKSRDEWAPRVTGTGHISPTQQVQCLFARGTIQAVQAFLHCRVELPHA
jgi:hypothetical protein